MEYQKIINLLENTPNHQIINDESRYNLNSKIKLKTSMLRSSLFANSDAYILVGATIRIPNTAAVGAEANN